MVWRAPWADHRPHVIERDRPDGPTFKSIGLAGQLFQKRLVNPGIHDGPRAGRALLPLVPESRCHHAATALSRSASPSTIMAFLPPISAITRLIHTCPAGLRGQLIDPQTHVARSGEGNEARLGMLAPAHRRPPRRCRSASEARAPGSRPRADPHEFAPIIGVLFDGLRTTVLPVTREATVMPARIASGKFHGELPRAASSVAIQARIFSHVLMKNKSAGKVQPRHLEVRVQDYFANGLVARDTGSSLSPISFIRTTPRSEKDFSDSLYVVPGDELVFKYTLFSNPSASVVAANIIDSTARGISIGNESLTLNEIPIISAAQFNGVFSSSITPFVKKGKNELEFERNGSSRMNTNSRINHVAVLRKGE